MPKSLPCKRLEVVLKSQIASIDGGCHMKTFYWLKAMSKQSSLVYTQEHSYFLRREKPEFYFNQFFSIQLI